MGDVAGAAEGVALVPITRARLWVSRDGPGQWEPDLVAHLPQLQELCNGGLCNGGLHALTSLLWPVALALLLGVLF